MESVFTVEQPPDGADVHFGIDAWNKLVHYCDLLVREGEKRGLVGPREYEKIWTRHILNSTAITEFIPQNVRVADVGSGAGFPGIVCAIVRPDLTITLIDSMERRCVWLNDVVAELELKNVVVKYNRSQDLKGSFQTDIVTARAVASVKKLLPLTMPILCGGGSLVALKGDRVNQEIDEAIPELRKFRAEYADVHPVVPFGCVEETKVLIVKKK